MAMTVNQAQKILGFPMIESVFGEQCEIGSFTPENLMRMTRKKLSSIAESQLQSWEEAEAEAEVLRAFKTACGYFNRNSQPVETSTFESYTANSSRVRILPLTEQIDIFGRAIKPIMNMSIYIAPFDCPCGSSHQLDERVSILREGYMKILALCPVDPSYVITVKIKTLLVVKFQGLQTVCGSRVRTMDDRKLIGELITG